MPRAEWRASVREEFDARTAGACAVLRKGVSLLKATPSLTPGLDALDAVCARVSNRGADAAAYVCCSCLANADVEEDYSDGRDASSGSPPGASPRAPCGCCRRCTLLEQGYFAFLLAGRSSSRTRTRPQPARRSRRSRPASRANVVPTFV